MVSTSRIEAALQSNRPTQVSFLQHWHCFFLPADFLVGEVIRRADNVEIKALLEIFVVHECHAGVSESICSASISCISYGRLVSLKASSPKLWQPHLLSLHGFGYWLPCPFTPRPARSERTWAQLGSPGQELDHLKPAKNSFPARCNLMGASTWRCQDAKT